MRPRLVLVLLAAACVPPGHADRSAFDPPTPPPRIRDVRLRCDDESGTWRVDVATSAWASGAVLLWTLDGVYVERHDGFRSVAAHPEGTSDQLRNDISVVADFRGSGNGRTSFTCRDTPSAALWVLDLERRRSDCIHGGPDPERILALEAVGDCPATWNEPVETDPPAETDPGETDPRETDAG